LDGAGTSSDSRVIIVGATNRPAELDEAARRRFVKRIYIPLPNHAGRHQLLTILLQDVDHSLNEIDLNYVVDATDGYSGADIRSLCTEAAMGPVRELASRKCGLESITIDEVPPISRQHIEDALEAVPASVNNDDLQHYIDWNSSFGSFRKLK
jgi:SpoVK/Ycf46/Vps4 family AAA+-type ATPase